MGFDQFWGRQLIWTSISCDFQFSKFSIFAEKKKLKKNLENLIFSEKFSLFHIMKYPDFFEISQITQKLPEFFEIFDGNNVLSIVLAFSDEFWTFLSSPADQNTDFCWFRGFQIDLIWLQIGYLQIELLRRLSSIDSRTTNLKTFPEQV